MNPFQGHGEDNGARVWKAEKQPCGPPVDFEITGDLKIQINLTPLSEEIRAG